MTTDAPIRSYILCATPRSGSTLLCEMLAATGLAGRPNSFFRTPDLGHFARSWGLPAELGPDHPDFDAAYLAAMLRERRSATGIFGLRLMQDNLPEASARLDGALGTSRDLARQLEEAFGPPVFIHLSRRDKLAQAVSRVRAEQSGIWHQAPDGRVLEFVGPTQDSRYDPSRIAELLAELEHDDRAWTDFFRSRGIAPLRLGYEKVSADPRAALATILSALRLDPSVAETTPVGTGKLADETSAAWISRFRQDYPSVA